MLSLVAARRHVRVRTTTLVLAAPFSALQSLDLGELKSRLAKTQSRMQQLQKEEDELKDIMERMARIKTQRRMLVFEESRLKDAIVNTYQDFGPAGVNYGMGRLGPRVVQAPPPQIVLDAEKDEEKPSSIIKIKTKKIVKDAVPKPLTKRIREGWGHLKAELRHYWLGFKLLYANIGTAWGLAKLLLKGKSLTRRQYRMLVRTGTDIIQLAPTTAFIIIPGAELLLPFALKLFPGMLPSTFQKEEEQEEKAKKLLRARVAVASYFQDAVQELGEQLKPTKKKEDDGYGSDGEEEVKVSGQHLLDFLDRARNGAEISTEEIMKIAPLFRDELTLDTMSRPLLVSMCRLMGMNTYGGDGLLRYQLRSKIRELRNDDKEILFEGGVDAMDEADLRVVRIWVQT